MKKRAISLVVFISLIFSIVNVTNVAGASDVLKLKVTASEISNNKVTATISVAENPGLISYVLVLKFDNAKFSPMYNEERQSAVLDKKLFGSSMDSITSNSDKIGAENAARLDYITAVATTEGDNVTNTGELFSVEFNVLDNAMTVFPSELVVAELYTYNLSNPNANGDGQVPLDCDVENTNGLYVIKHNKELLSGGYETVSENLYAPVGSSVTANAKEFTNYMFDTNAANVLTGVVDAQGALVLECYYKLNSYTVSFDYQGATSSTVLSKTFKHGQKIEFPDTKSFSKNGYDFSGWYTELDNDNAIVSSNTIVTSNMTLYAGWTKRSDDGGGGGGGGGGDDTTMLTVKFESNGGSKVDNIKVEKGAKVAEPEKPVKDGFMFDGWYLDKALKTKYNFESVVNAGMTLYAAWKEIEDEKKDNDEISQVQNEIKQVLNTTPGVVFIQGDNNGNFNPESKITRAEISVIIYRLLLNTNDISNVNFNDVSDDEWYADSVKALAAKGIIKGYEDGCFYPSQYVTRAEVSAILSRLVTIVKNELIFSDVSEEHWAFQNIATAYKCGWIKGYEDGNFAPDMGITRAETVTIINRVLEREIPSGDACKFPDVPTDHWAYDYICAASN